MKIPFSQVIGCVVFLACSIMPFQAQNPFVTPKFTADPTARVFNGKLFVYPSTDNAECNEVQGSNGFCMPGYSMFSTDDLVNWTDHGVILDQNDVPWGAKNRYGMWAPDCVKKGDKYYLYYPGIPEDRSAFRRVGVCISDSPTGPFKPQSNYIKGVRGIDPNVLVDDDGQSYLYYGGGTGIGALKVAKLKDNMTEIEGSPKNIEGIPAAGYREASFMFKKDGVYYFTYARVTDHNYEIEYATADNPMGPFKFRGLIMPNIGFGTNHHSVVKYKGEWYLFYHYWSLSNDVHLRSIRADKIEFKPNGDIITKVATLRGIGTPKAGDIIQIDRHNGIEGAQTAWVLGNQPRGFQIEKTTHDGWVRFNNVDFGNGKLKKFYARVSSENSGKLHLRATSKNGPILATLDIPNTGGWESWQTLTTKFKTKTEGLKDIFLTFEGNGDDLFHINWIKFSSKDVKESDKERPEELAGREPKDIINPVAEEDKFRIPKKRGDDVQKIGQIFQIDQVSDKRLCNIRLHNDAKDEGFFVGGTNDEGHVRYNKVDFGKGTLLNFKAKVASNRKGGLIELRVDSIDAPILAQVEISNTGGWRNWELVSGKFTKQVTGVHDVFFTFEGDGSQLFNVDWVKISSTEIPGSDTIDKAYLKDVKVFNPNITTKRSNKILKVGDIIELERNSKINGARVIPVEGNQPDGFEIGYIKPNAYLKFDGIDFGSGNLKDLFAMVSSGSKGGQIEIRLDDLEGKVLATLDVPNTGGWTNWRVMKTPITYQTKGIHNIYCVFKGEGQYLLNVNWLRITSTDIPSSLTPHPLETAKKGYYSQE